MKHNTIFVFLLAIFLTACNSDIFIKEFLPDENEFTLNSPDTLVIPFKGENWDLDGIYQVGELRGNVYSLDGKLLHENVGLLGKYIRGMVRIVCDDSRFHLEVERSSINQLKIVAGRNIASEKNLSIHLTNGASRNTLTLNILQSEPFEVRSIEYHYDRLSTHKEERYTNNGINYYNDSSREQKVTLYPFREIYQQVSVKTDIAWYFMVDYLGAPLPELKRFDVVNGEAVLNDRTFPIDGKIHFIKSPELDNVEEEIHIAPFTQQQIQVIVWRKIAVLPFTIHAYSPQLNEEMTFAGSIEDSCPVEYEIRKDDPIEIEK